MPFRHLDSAFFYQELKKLVSFGDVKVICALSLLDPPLVHSQRFLAPHDLSGSHLLIIIRISHLVGPLEKLIVDVSYVVVVRDSPEGPLKNRGILLKTCKKQKQDTPPT
jgi:hypothetical protein